ncbi:MAG: MNIO family bufferin maturase [Hyphomicrobiaceae bacterium]
MEARINRTKALPDRAGVGLKPEHFAELLQAEPDVGWFEVHPENYMGSGGPPHRYLTAIRELYPLSLHGVGLSIGSADPLDRNHLSRLKALIERYEPDSFSEHLAWSTHDESFLNDLLPLPYTDETLRIVCDHVDEVQDYLARRMLLENPATYVVFEESTYEEIEFLEEIASRTGCGLLLDVNNVFVSCTNHARSANDYIDRFPIALVDEIHLAGHAEDQDDAGQRLLIDAHDRRVIGEVWKLFERAIARDGPRPTLIEWDNDIPAWPVLFAEAQHAESLLRRISMSRKARDHAMA